MIIFLIIYFSLACNYNNTMPKEKSAGAVVFRRENNQIYYLLLHYQSGHWDFPKGHIEAGEDDIATVKRETKEETGISDIRIIGGFREMIKYFFRVNYHLKKEDKLKVPWTFKMVVFYLAETKIKEVKISEEHTGFMWLPYEESLKRLTYKNAKEILKKANGYLVSKKSL